MAASATVGAAGGANSNEWAVMVPPASDSGTCRVAPSSDTSSAWLPSLSSRRSGVLPRGVPSIATTRARRRRFDRQRRGRRRPRRGVAHRQHLIDAEARAAARRRARRPSTAAWCASRSAPAAKESALRAAAGTGNGDRSRRDRRDGRCGRRRSGRRDARTEGEGRRREGNRRGLVSGVRHHRLRAARRHARERRWRTGRPGGGASRDRDGMGVALGARSHAGLVRVIDRRGRPRASRASRRQGASPPSGGADRTSAAAAAARCSAETGTVGACATDAANAGATRIRVPTPGFVSSCDGSVRGRRQDAGGSGSREARGTRDDDCPIVRSGRRPRRRGVRTRRRRASSAGSAGSSTARSARSRADTDRSTGGSRLVSPAGSSMGSGGTYGAGVGGGVNSRRCGRAAAPPHGPAA